MVQFPEINESDIQKWVGNKAFQRGYRYFEDEAILNPRRRGQSLISECQGSQPAPYRVEIRLGAEGVLDGRCSCPAGDGGHCKHAAALLLTWLHEPELFIEVPELELVLEERSKDDLISLIREMVTRHPDLEQLLELSALSNLPSGEILQPDLIAQQIRRAFSSAGGEQGDNAQIAENLQTILDLGEDLLDREEVQNASTVYETLMEGMLVYEDCLYHDQGGDFGQVLAECEQGIQDCLGSTQDAGLRQGLLHTLFDFYLWDLQAGGLGFADETPSILAQQANAEEKQMISGWIQEELNDSGEWGEDSQRRSLGGLWLTLMSGALDDETYLRICRVTGRSQDLIDRLLSLDRVDEALAAARSPGKNNLTAIADLFEAHGRPQLGKQIITEQPDSETDLSRLEWLKQYARRHHEGSEALRMAESTFWMAQTQENYIDLLEAAADIHQQAAVRMRVIERLENAGNFYLLVEIYLLENEIDQALAALERVNSDIWGERLATLRRQVAQAVEGQRPREAIRQYLLLTEALIEKRSRGSYAEAALLLQRIRRLYQALGEEDRSEIIIQSLRSEYERVPALMDEMRRAGL
jgi:tetratricopeptide (TPR) repeat protein